MRLFRQLLRLRPTSLVVRRASLLAAAAILALWPVGLPLYCRATTVVERRPSVQLPVKCRYKGHRPPESILKKLGNRGVEVGPRVNNHACTIVYLHGFAGNGRQYLGDGQTLPWLFGVKHAPCLRAVLPTAERQRQPWGQLENSWYCYRVQKTNHVGDPTVLRSTRQLLETVVLKEVERLGGEGHRVFLGGLSQGCAVALDTYLRLAPHLKLGGFVGSVGFVPSDDLGFSGSTRALEVLAADEEQAKRPIWMQCATDDDEEIPWTSLASPSLERVRGALPGLKVDEIWGRGHSIDEWEEDYVNAFVKANAKYAYR